MLQARVTESSQQYRVRQELQAAGIQHGEDVAADIVVRVGNPHAATPAMATVYFCDMGPITPTAITGQPDGQPLPANVTLTGLTVPGPGYWRVPFQINLNGSIHLTADPFGQVVEVEDPHADLRQPAELILT